LKIAPNLLTDKEIRLFRYFQEMLEHRVKKVNIKLKSWECLIIDNKKLLHWRTAFEDPNRLLYRIRFNNNIWKTKLC
jgi:alpha-ketoglutarate-dependent taurine dioxygenase